MKSSKDDGKMKDNISKNDKSEKPWGFKKGWKGGPGRSAGSRNNASIALEEIGQDNAIAVYRKMISIALEGDPNGCFNACKFIIDRVSPARKGTRVAIANSGANTAQKLEAVAEKVIGLMFAGEISAEEAIDIGKAIEQKFKLITDTDIVRKIEETCKKANEALE